MPSIVVITGRSRGFSLNLERDCATIGRDENCSLQVLDDLVSRRHLQIRGLESGDGFEAIDNHSANGVYVNGQRISSPTPLRDNDLILIGDSKLVFTHRQFDDAESALEFFKLRGEHDRSTIVSPSGPGEGKEARGSRLEG